ncbi:MAG: RNA polymerase sigma factor [Bacteroidales bacterium]|nr:RNA polymerase sigma factor [Bacteroidales bacterium]MCF8328565.1 RNA polymerase sigma factor [Bacteroidales bacterium]
MPSYSDNEILELFNQPEKRSKAFEMLVNKYQQRVYWIIRRMLLNHEDTNDVMQETFIKIWQNIANFRQQSGLYAWIYRIAINEVYTFFRKKKRLRNLPTTELKEEMLQSLQCDPWFDGNQAQLKLQEAILALPKKQQMVFNMRYFEEIPYAEMSKILDTSKGSLKASYHWAVKKIEENLKDN